MKVLFKFFLILFMILLQMQCQKDRDAYYAEPDWIGKSIYETLKEQGRFGLYLQLADKTEYAVSLKGNGFWTVFAPNDVAVQQWMNEKGYGSAENVPVDEAAKIVAYSLLFNQYRFDQLSHVLNNGWDSLTSVKKRTAYYETIHKEEYKGDSIWVVSPTMSTSSSLNIPTNDNNYKYVPFFLDAQFKKQSLSATDYTTFFEKSTYTGRNIQGASVLQEDIFASNGVIHEIDKVNEPLPKFEDILKEPAYSRYWSLIQMKDDADEPYFFSYLHVQSVTEYYQKMFPSRNIDRVYVKAYAGLLALPLDVERYTSLRTVSGDHPEKGGYTMFAPNNDGVQRFFDEKLTDYYASIDDVPAEVWRYFINAQMCDGLVYPGQYHRLENYWRDYINGAGLYGPRWDNVKDIYYKDRRPASNGFFYGGLGYITNNRFESVITEVQLNKTYALMWKAFEYFFSSSLITELTKSQVNGYPDENYTLLLIPDELLLHEAEDASAGFSWAWAGDNTNDMRYQFYHPWGVAFANERMQRLVRSHIFKRNRATTINFSSGDNDYGGYGHALNEYGDMVRYQNSQLQMLGNYDNSNEWVRIVKKKDFANGTVYTLANNRILQYGRCGKHDGEANPRCFGRTMSDYLSDAARLNPNLTKSVAYMNLLVSRGNIEFPKENTSYNTVLLPNNAAIDAAIAAGHLPATDISTIADGDIPAFLTLIEPFFKHHVIQGQVFIEDGIENSLLMSTGEIKREHRALTRYQLGLSGTFLTVKKTGKRLTFSSNSKIVDERRDAVVVPGYNRSNLFAPKSVIHEINNFLLPPTEL